MKAEDIRASFLDYFSGHDHHLVSSAPLVPKNDPSLFFVNAGMVQFKDVFTGQDQQDYVRATSVQKCLRVSGKHNDLENVGRTPRHHTFFEMLGNFSFGDYFKKDACNYAWEWLTESLKMDPNRLWITVYEEDDEAFELWRKMGIPQARLQRMGAKENFWSMGETGPCGPCSEIHYDHGPSVSDDTRGPAGGGDRYVEIWNLVFMQFDQKADGTRVALPKPSIDTGAGLERIAAVMQGKYSNYDTDLFIPLIECGSRLAGTPYGKSHDTDVALRVIADHARAAAFLIGDGVMPSNEARGYVLRRIMRRAIRFGVKLGIDRPFLHECTQSVVDNFGTTYPDLKTRMPFIDEVVRGEEERFRHTLDKGLHLLQAALEKAGKGGTLPGDVAFTLSDTFGFPLDLTQLIASEQEVQVDSAGFEQSLEAQRARGRAAWKGSGETSVSALWQEVSNQVPPTEFTGYENTSGTAKVLAIARVEADDKGDHLTATDKLNVGEKGILITDQTPFYGESGGQVGDTGSIGSFLVADTTQQSGLYLHHGRTTDKAVKVGEALDTQVTAEIRDQTRRNHTATHLLHSALRQILGDHVNQKGSLVGPNRLRFDFSHHKPMTKEELIQVGTLVNEQILANTSVSTTEKPLEDALEDGAMALFGEKYDAHVRVVAIPGFSVELCGGTHCQRTGDIGLLYITSETGVAAGVRRIEAQTGTGALEAIQRQNDLLRDATDLLKTSPEQLVPSIQKLQSDRKGAERLVQQLKQEHAQDAMKEHLKDVGEIGGVHVLVAEVDGDLREHADRIRDKFGSAFIVLAQQESGKVRLLAAGTKDIAGSRIHAGHIIRDIAHLVDGRGGGRPDMAQAGGSTPAGIPAALDLARELIGKTLAP